MVVAEEGGFWPTGAGEAFQRFVVLGAQLLMGVLFGVLGLFLADPLMAMIKVALERRSEQVNDEPTPAAADGP